MENKASLGFTLIELLVVIAIIAILAAPQWKPVAGIANNAVTVGAGDAARYFRLIK